MPHRCTLEQAVDHVLSEIDGPIHLGLPLGLGKPNRWVNALYERVRDLPERQLTIYTALCLARPRADQDLQRRFLEPFVDRVYGCLLYTSRSARRPMWGSGRACAC